MFIHYVKGISRILTSEEYTNNVNFLFLTEKTDSNHYTAFLKFQAKDKNIQQKILKYYMDKIYNVPFIMGEHFNVKHFLQN